MNEPIRVSKFEFVKNTSRYLKGGIVIITHRGEDCLRLEPVGYEKEYFNIVAKDGGGKPIQFEVKAKTKQFKPNLINYGCGCERVDGKYLCPKHGRV